MIILPLKPIFTKDQVNLSNSDLSDKLNEILYEKLIDLSGFRYDLYTHRLLTTAVLLAKEYDFESVIETIKDDTKLRKVYEYLYEIYKINDQIDLTSDDFLQAIQYDNWHENSRYVTDHLDEDMQPKEILLKAVSRYSGTLEDDEVIQCINDLKEFNSCSHTDEDGWNSFSVEINDVLTVVV